MAREAVSGEFHLECQVRVSAERAVASPKLRAPSVVGEVVMEEAEALDKDTQHSNPQFVCTSSCLDFLYCRFRL